jgi:hypothetical protein
MCYLWAHYALDCLIVSLLFVHQPSLLFLSASVSPFLLPSVSVRAYCPHGFKSPIWRPDTTSSQHRPLARRGEIAHVIDADRIDQRGEELAQARDYRLLGARWGVQGLQLCQVHL